MYDKSLVYTPHWRCVKTPQRLPGVTAKSRTEEPSAPWKTREIPNRGAVRSLENTRNERARYSTRKGLASAGATKEWDTSDR